MAFALRSAPGLALIGALVVAAIAAGAEPQRYLMTGKFARTAGRNVNFPVIGENPDNTPNCGRTTMNGAMIPGMTPIYQGYRSSIRTTMVATPPINMTMFAAPHGCVSIAGEVVATAPGPGKAFEIPSMAFTRPAPGKTVAVRAFTPPNVQIATSFELTGPPMSLPTTGPDVPNGTMNDGMNTAMFRYFHQSAWLSQTGRAGAQFTWCFGNPNCTVPWQAMGVDKNGDPHFAYPVHQAIVKYTPGPNRFGGTMSHVLYTGPNTSSLAVSQSGALLFFVIAGMGSQPTGRGYADFVTDPFMGGPAFAMFMVGPVYVPQLMSSQTLITTLMTPIPASGSQVTVGVLKNFGFPFTTGTVIARNTGTTGQKNPVVVTLTGMGGDVVTAMGARNISLVAGAVAGVDTLGSENPDLLQVFLPEPRASVQRGIGAIALLAIAIRRRWSAARVPRTRLFRRR